MAPEDKTTGQSVMAMTDAAGAVIGCLLGGVFIRLGGVRLMLIAGSAAALAGTLLVLIASRSGLRGKGDGSDDSFLPH